MKKIISCFLFVLTVAFFTGICIKDNSKVSNNEKDNQKMVYPNVVLNEGDIVVAPDGNALAPGTVEEPSRLVTAITNLKPGNTIYLLPGTYEFEYRILIDGTLGGQPGKMKTIMPYSSRVVLDFSKDEVAGDRGIQLSCDYWHIKGIDIFGAQDNGMLVCGSYNIIEDCCFYDNKDTGLQIARSSSAFNEPLDSRWPSFNTILNCTSYNNCDENGEDADGFACKLTTGPGNVFDGCISYNNVDDGWDLFTKGILRTDGSGSGKISPITIKNCVAFNNGYTIQKFETSDGIKNVAYGTASSDGNGFKLGGDDVSMWHYVENCIAFNNLAHGFTDNSNPGKITLKNCTSYNNGIGNTLPFQVYLRDGFDLVTKKRKYTPTTLTNFAVKNNFDLARHEDGVDRNDISKSITSDNSFNGCLSVNTDVKNTDLYRGDAKNTLFFSTKTYLYFNSSANKADSGSKVYQDVYSGVPYSINANDIFVSVETPNMFDDTERLNIHKLFRNLDGSVNLGNLLKINPNGPAATLGYNNTAIGANLHK